MSLPLPFYTFIKTQMALQVAARKRLRMHCVEIDELVLTSNEGTQRDLSTSYQKMKSLILGLRNEILTDIEIHKQGILPRYV